MKRIILIAIALGVTALGFSSGCTKNDSVLLEEPQSGTVSTTSPDGTLEPSIEDADGDADGDAADEAAAGNASSSFVPVELASKASAVTSTSTTDTLLGISFEGSNESTFTPKVSWQKAISGGMKTTVALEASKPLTVDLAKDLFTLNLKGTIKFDGCVVCPLINDLEMNLNFELERDPDDLTAENVKLAYTGPNFILQKPDETITLNFILVYDLPDSGDRTLNVSMNYDPSKIILERIDAVDEDSLAGRTIKINLGSTSEFSLDVERDIDSGLISSGDMNLAGSMIDMLYTTSLTGVPGSEILDIAGNGTLNGSGVTLSIETDGLFRKIGDPAIAHERAMIMDAMILPFIQLAPLWAILP